MSLPKKLLREEMDQFDANLAAITDISIEDAKNFVDSSIKTLEPVYHRIQKNLETQQKRLEEMRKNLSENFSEAKMLSMSVYYEEHSKLTERYSALQIHFAKAMSHLDEIERKESEKKKSFDLYSQLSELSINSKPGKMPFVDHPLHNPLPVQGDISILKEEVRKIISIMKKKWRHFNFSDKEYVMEQQKKFNILTSDVRGDGACGIRAFVSSLCAYLGIAYLPYDPDNIVEVLTRIKLAMCSLLDIINKDSRNNSVIRNLVNNPFNKIKKPTFDSYKWTLFQHDYYMTTDDFRILLLLFNLVEPTVCQVNIFRDTSSDTQAYESITADGNFPAPVSRNGINIYHKGLHYMSIQYIDVEYIPPIFEIKMDRIYLPEE
jgi:hypothetical protein